MSDAAKPSVATAMRYFGKLPGQTLADFKHDDWDKLTDKDKAELCGGIADGSLTY